MRGKTPRKLAVGAAVLALLVSAAGCSGEDPGGNTGQTGGELKLTPL